VLALMAVPNQASAHHVLGRPSYALDEESNTPPSMYVETLIGQYFVNYMVFPAFPEPNRPGRVHLYAKHKVTKKPFQGRVTFKVHDNSWASWLGFGRKEETLGVQPPDGNVFRQGFLFKAPGAYIIRAEFHEGDTPYQIDFPLRVGPPSRVGPLGITVGVIIIILLGVSLFQRRRAMTGKVRTAHAQRITDDHGPVASASGVEDFSSQKQETRS